MCRDTLSVGWDGTIYDCDFNQQLQLGLGEELVAINTEKATNEHTSSDSTNNDSNDSNNGSNIKRRNKSIYDITSTTDLKNHKIVTDSHCFGCTAGAGSSCQGATA